MAALPYMQLYVADYLGDTGHLTTEEHGAYLLLIMSYWQSGKPLRSDSERLANVVRMSIERFEKIKQNLSEFFIEQDGFWFHKRIESDLNKVEQKSNKARQSAHAKVVRTLSERTANAQRTVTYTDTDTDTDNKKTKAKKETAYSNEFETFWSLYPPRRRTKKVAAYKIWTSKKLDNDVEEINAGLRRYLVSDAWNKDNGEYCHLPTTFLNQQLWLDNPAAYQGAKTKLTGAQVGQQYVLTQALNHFGKQREEHGNKFTGSTLPSLELGV